jgi:hypothetical protein
MKRGFFSVAALVSVLAAVVVVPLQPASAYPPGTAMTVSASPNPVAAKQSITLTASNVKPGCRVAFSVGEREATAKESGGSASVSVKAPSRLGTYKVTAKCSKGGERATTYLQVVGRGEVHGPDHVCKSKGYDVSVVNFASGSRVTVVLRKATFGGSNGGSTVSLSKAGRTNSHGAKTYHFNVNRAGVYVVSAVAPGQRAASAVAVDNC